MHTTRLSAQRRGVTVVEMAIVIPLFVLALFAFVEIGYVLMIDSITENAAYEGARRGIVPGATEDAAKQAALDLVTASGLKSANVDVVLSRNEQGNNVRQLTVTVNAPLSQNSIFIGPFLGNMVITRSSTMIHESDLRYRFTRNPGTVADPLPRPRGRGGASR